MKVAFVDLQIQYLSIKSDIDAAIQKIINESTFVGGSVVTEFEKSFASQLGVKHCIGVGNGTDAIYIALRMLGIGSGDEVITTAASWISTSETITQTGAKPVFVDINPNTFTIDVNQIASKITPRTKAIIPVHLYGQASHIRDIKTLCDKHKLYLIEDCAQSHLTEDEGQYVGTFGNAATFSFYPGKNLGAYGDAGAVVTNDDALAEKMRMYANHGALKKHQHKIEGINSRLDTMQAAILMAKLPHLKKWTQLRVTNAASYSTHLKDVAGLELPATRPKTLHSFHLYVIRSKHRDALKDFLEQKGIQTAIHYPTALPNLKAYNYLGHQESDFPIASSYQNEILSLPMFPELSIEQINYVCNAIKEYYGTLES